MSDNVDLLDYSKRTLIRIKQPGSVRDTKGNPITSILMSIDEARAVLEELQAKLSEVKP